MAAGKRGIALALGGGGARGFAHVGVIEVLHRHRVPLVGIVGTSAGAVAGAGYALGHPPEVIRQRVLEFAQSRLATDTKVRALIAEQKTDSWRGFLDKVNRMVCQGRMFKNLLLEDSVLEPDYMKKTVRFFLPEAEIDTLPIPFAAVTTDLLTGETVVLDSGSLRQAVLASSSIPGFAPPVELEGRYLVDGGVTCLVPVEIARRLWGAPVLAVNVDRDIKSDSLPSHALECALRASDLQSVALGRLQTARADLAIQPDVGNFYWADFVQAESIMDRGVEAAEAALPGIRRLLRGPGWLQRLGRTLGWG